jgi:hypothetical protein
MLLGMRPRGRHGVPIPFGPIPDRLDLIPPTRKAGRFAATGGFSAASRGPRGPRTRQLLPKPCGVRRAEVDLEVGDVKTTVSNSLCIRIPTAKSGFRLYST